MLSNYFKKALPYNCSFYQSNKAITQSLFCFFASSVSKKTYIPQLIQTANLESAINLQATKSPIAVLMEKVIGNQEDFRYNENMDHEFENEEQLNQYDAQQLIQLFQKQEDCPFYAREQNRQTIEDAFSHHISYDSIELVTQFFFESIKADFIPHQSLQRMDYLLQNYDQNQQNMLIDSKILLDLAISYNKFQHDPQFLEELILKNYFNNIQQNIGNDINHLCNSLNIANVIMRKNAENMTNLWNKFEQLTIKILYNNEDAIDTSQYLDILFQFGIANQGTNSLWKEFEKLFIEKMSTISPSNVIECSTILLERGRKQFLQNEEMKNYLTLNILRLDISGLYLLDDLLIKANIKELKSFNSVARNQIINLFKQNIESSNLSYQEREVDEEEFTIEQLAQIASTLVKVGDAKENISLWEELEQKILSMNQIPLEISSVLICSFAQANQANHKLYRHLTQRILYQINRLDKKTLYNIVYHLGQADHIQNSVVNSIKTWISQHEQEVNLKFVSLCLWYCSKYNNDGNEELIDVLLQFLKSEFKKAKASELSIILTALAKLRVPLTKYQEICDEIYVEIKNQQISELYMEILPECFYFLSHNKLIEETLISQFEKKLLMNMDTYTASQWICIFTAKNRNVKLSREFIDQAELTIIKKLKKFDAIQLQQLSKGLSHQFSVSNDLWHAVQSQIVKTFSEMNTQILSQCMLSIGRGAVIDDSFWAQIESSLMMRIQNTDPASLARIIDAIGRLNKGTKELWQGLQQQLIKHLSDSHTIISIKNIKHIVAGLSFRKKGNNQVWTLLERRVLQIVENNDDINLKIHDIFAIVKSFKRLNRGSSHLWDNVIPIIMSKVDKIKLKNLINLVQSLDKSKEFTIADREFFTRSCIDRVLESEEKFPKFLNQISFSKYLAPSLTEEDIQVIKKKIDEFSAKGIDSEISLELVQYLARIKRNREQKIENRE